MIRCLLPLLSGLFTVFTLHCSWGLAVPLTLPDAIEKADLIAHLRIEANTGLSSLHRTETRTRLPDGSMRISVAVRPGSGNPDQYTETATALVVRAFKGAPGEGPIFIRHTNGYTCPNVRYVQGKEYLAFLSKDPATGDYVTMHFSAGQFRIEDGEVLSFYLMKGYDPSRDSRLPYERVSLFLKGRTE